MAQNITLLGASYSAVPAVNLPITGGGTARFTDVTDTTASAGDVASGKYFYTASGVRTQGTSSGGGGGGTLIGTLSLGELSTSSTSAVTIDGKTLSISKVNAYDLVIVEVSVDNPVNNAHLATVSFVLLTAGSTVGTKNGATIMSNKWNAKASSTGVVTTRNTTAGYGVQLNTATITSGTLSMTFYMRYSSTQTGTINGTYTARAYGVKLYDLIGG